MVLFECFSTEFGFNTSRSNGLRSTMLEGSSTARLISRSTFFILSVIGNLKGEVEPLLFQFP